MRRKTSLIILCALVLSSLLLLSSCYTKEIKAVSRNASDVAVKYMNEKYGEKFKNRDIQEVKVDEGYTVFSTGPNGRADVIFKDGTTVFFNSNSMTLSDNREIEALKADLKNYIEAHAITQKFELDTFLVGQYYIGEGRLTDIPSEGLGKKVRYSGNIEEFLNETTDLSIDLKIFWRADDDNHNYVDENLAFAKLFEKAFTGMSVNVDSAVIRSAPYDGGLVEKDPAGFYINDYAQIYSFLNNISRVDAFYNDGYLESEPVGWVFDQIYPSYVELEPGLQVASQVSNLHLTDASQLDYQAFTAEGGIPPEIKTYLSENYYSDTTYGITPEADDIKRVIDPTGDLQEEPTLYLLSFKPEISEAFDMSWIDGPVVKIDKNTFAGGLLKQGYNICALNFYPSGPSIGGARYQNVYYEDDDMLFFQKENRQLLILTNGWKPVDLVPAELVEPEPVE